MPKKLFISDVHVGAGRFSDESKDTTKYPYDWDRLSLEETKNFIDFIRYVHSHYDCVVEE